MGTVSLRGISKRFGAQEVIHGLSLEVEAGEFVTLLGPSGCGKTTLLRMIAGLEHTDEGEIWINGERCNDVPAQRRPIAMVFQSYALFPHMSVRDNVLFGLRIKKTPPEAMEQKLAETLAMLRLGGLERRLPRQISGGQRQRVALARALVLDPDVLLLDEPLSNLDAALRETAMEELKRVHRQVHKTVVYVTHNQVEAMTMSDRIAVLDRGVMEQFDTPRMVYDEPRTLFAAGFVGSPSMNFYDGRIALQGERTGVDTPLGFLPLDGARRDAAEPMVGSAVRVGVRPHCVLSIASLSSPSRRASDALVEVTTELVESLGDRSLVVGRCRGEAVVRFLVDRDQEVKPDERMEVVVDGRRVHLFDPQTGRNLFAE